MGTRKKSETLRKKQCDKKIKFATPEVMSEIKCSQTIANSQMKRLKKIK